MVILHASLRIHSPLFSILSFPALCHRVAAQTGCHLGSPTLSAFQLSLAIPPTGRRSEGMGGVCSQSIYTPHRHHIRSSFGEWLYCLHRATAPTRVLSHSNWSQLQKQFPPLPTSLKVVRAAHCFWSKSASPLSVHLSRHLPGISQVAESQRASKPKANEEKQSSNTCKNKS